MTPNGVRATETKRVRVRLNTHVLVGNLVTGAVCLSPLAILSWPLLVVGAGYVVVGSLFLAAVYARAVLSTWQEVLAHIAAWLAVVGLWLWIIVSGEPADEPYAGPVTMLFDGLYVAFFVATPLYWIWQVFAWPVRHYLAERPPDESLAPRF